MLLRSGWRLTSDLKADISSCTVCRMVSVIPQKGWGKPGKRCLKGSGLCPVPLHGPCWGVHLSCRAEGQFCPLLRWEAWSEITWVSWAGQLWAWDHPWERSYLEERISDPGSWGVYLQSCPAHWKLGTQKMGL